jgi:hypothetical protein
MSSRLDISQTELKQVIHGGISWIIMKLKLILLEDASCGMTNLLCCYVHFLWCQFEVYDWVDHQIQIKIHKALFE